MSNADKTISLPSFVEGLRIVIDCMEREHADAEAKFKGRMNQLNELYRQLLKCTVEIIKEE